MPNRVIKESIKSSPQIDSLTWFEEIVFYRLMVSADDYGCFDGRSVFVKNALFPTKENVTKKAVEDAITKLVSVGLLCAYTVNGMPYLFFPTWEKHQRIRNKHRKYPEPPEDGLTANGCQWTADGRPESESNSNQNLESETKERVRRHDAFWEYAGEDKQMLSALQDFEEMRKKLKKPLTERARQMIVSQLQKLSGDRKEQIAILEQSVMRSWAGVFALKKDQGKDQTGKPAMQAERDYTEDWDGIGYDNTCGKDYGGSF